MQVCVGLWVIMTMHSLTFERRVSCTIRRIRSALRPIFQFEPRLTRIPETRYGYDALYDCASSVDALDAHGSQGSLPSGRGNSEYVLGYWDDVRAVDLRVLCVYFLLHVAPFLILFTSQTRSNNFLSHS